jgi:hypothetical protein
VDIVNRSILSLPERGGAGWDRWTMDSNMESHKGGEWGAHLAAVVIMSLGWGHLLVSWVVGEFYSSGGCIIQVIGFSR